MPKKGHTEGQIVAVLRPLEAGAQVAEVCRKTKISEASYCRLFRERELIVRT